MKCEEITALIPDQMKHLDRDHRGFPIPYMVLRDAKSVAHFAINDEHLRLNCFANDLCSVCGKKLLRGRWFVGGPLSAYHPNGAYNDPPLHKDCMVFSMQVCPWLAMPSFNPKQASEDKFKKVATEGVAAFADYTMMPGRPLVFVAVMATKQKIHQNRLQVTVVPEKPYLTQQFWRNGVLLTNQDGAEAVAEALNAALPQTQDPKFYVEGVT